MRASPGAGVPAWVGLGWGKIAGMHFLIFLLLPCHGISLSRPKRTLRPHLENHLDTVSTYNHIQWVRSIAVNCQYHPADHDRNGRAQAWNSQGVHWGWLHPHCVQVQTARIWSKSTFCAQIKWCFNQISPKLQDGWAWTSCLSPAWPWGQFSALVVNPRWSLLLIFLPFDIIPRMFKSTTTKFNPCQASFFLACAGFYQAHVEAPLHSCWLKG